MLCPNIIKNKKQLIRFLKKNRSCSYANSKFEFIFNNARCDTGCTDHLYSYVNFKDGISCDMTQCSTNINRYILNVAKPSLTDANIHTIARAYDSIRISRFLNSITPFTGLKYSDIRDRVLSSSNYDSWLANELDIFIKKNRYQHNRKKKEVEEMAADLSMSGYYKHTYTHYKNKKENI